MIKKKNQSNTYLILFLSLIFINYAYLINKGLITFPFELILFILVITLFSYFVMKNGYKNILSSISINFFMIIYITGCMSYFFLLRDLNLEPFHNARALWLAFLATWSVDAGAYFTGKYFGKRKLAPKISPNKTREGAIGGIVLCILIVLIYVCYLKIFTYYLIIYAVLVAVVAIIGDLFESALKRNVELKDSGNFLPGHGGVLDRFDSLLFTIPFTYYFLILFIK
jgi:phosphatidate cytidylyltransferase